MSGKLAVYEVILGKHKFLAGNVSPAQSQMIIYVG
jgi:hypothetical protein